MDDNNLIHDVITEVPALPDDLYDGINRSIHHGIMLRRTLYAIAAVLLLAIFPLILQHRATSDNESAEVLQTDVQNELELVSDYLNAQDINDYVALYTADTNNEP